MCGCGGAFFLFFSLFFSSFLFFFFLLFIYGFFVGDGEDEEARPVFWSNGGTNDVFIFYFVRNLKSEVVLAYIMLLLKLFG